MPDKRSISYPRRFRQKIDVARYRGLIDEPVTGEVTLPANGWLSEVLDLERTHLGYRYRGTVITPTAGAQLDVDTGLGRWAKISDGA